MLARGYIDAAIRNSHRVHAYDVGRLPVRRGQKAQLDKRSSEAIQTPCATEL